MTDLEEEKVGRVYPISELVWAEGEGLFLTAKSDGGMYLIQKSAVKGFCVVSGWEATYIPSRSDEKVVRMPRNSLAEAVLAANNHYREMELLRYD